VKKPVLYIILVLCIIFLAGVNNAYSQSAAYNKKINWKSNIINDHFKGDNIPVNKKYFLHFDDAVYDNKKAYLPIYTDRIAIPDADDGGNYVPQMENMIFAEIESKQLEGVIIPDDIQEEILIDHNYAYERKKAYLTFSFIPIRKNPNNGRLEKIISFSIKLNKTNALNSGVNNKSIYSYASSSVLSSGQWYKIRIQESGIYKLSYTQLKEMGFDQPGSIKLFGNGCPGLPIIQDGNKIDDLRENAILKIDGNDGSFDDGDYYLFYGHGPVQWIWNADKNFFEHKLNPYSDYSYYFISQDTGDELRVSTYNSVAGNPENIVNSFDAFAYIEEEDTSFIKSGREWFGDHFNMDLDRSYNFNFPGIINSENIKIKSRLVCRSSRFSPNSSFTLSSGGINIQTLIFPGIDFNLFEGQFATQIVDYDDFKALSDDVQIDILFNKSISTSEGWLDYISLNARRKLEMVGDQMIFQDIQSTGENKLSEFRLSNFEEGYSVWDVTDPTRAVEIKGDLINKVLNFRIYTDDLRKFIAFSNSADSYLIPEITGDNLGEVPNQDLHKYDQPDMIIIANKILINEARELADFHIDNDNMSVLLVTQEQVFNEFSSGGPDAVAIRDFVKMFYDRANSEAEIPKYLLLYGDGSFNNKSNSSQNSNLIVTYQSDESLDPKDSYVTDDFFGLLDNGELLGFGLLDIGMGRIPVRDAGQAYIANQKIFHYSGTSTFGDWRNLVSFIADDEDANGHMRDADTMAEMIKNNYPEFNIEKIYLDAFPQLSTSAGQFYPAVNDAINNRMDKGALIVDYIGHGSESGLAHERILGISDIKRWSNIDRMPLFMTATCEFSRFDDYKNVSAGEWVFLNEKGGGIALFTTTRLVFSSGNRRLNTEFYKYVFENDENGNRYRLGDILRLTKNSTGSDTNKLNFTLLGDPALKLSYPEFSIKTLTVNGKPVDQEADTLKAFSHVTVTGYIEDNSGNKLENFNGIVYPTVYDKYTKTSTLRNDGGSVLEFDVMNSVIYKGKASISNGDFSYSFIVPKDISYNYGYGKLSYYADNGENDAAGMDDRLIIGGSLESAGSDNEGPVIELYMNDSSFVFGGMTNESPVLVAYVSDINGINTTGNGIGHDITAILDDDNKNTFVLNDYYEAELNSYRSGVVKFPLSDLEPGSHQLKFKIWDAYNNSSEDYIEFFVRESEELIIDHLYNYPNPFTTKTSFYFEHNRANEDLDVLIQVFTLSGKLVKSIEFLSALGTQVNNDSFRVGPVDWDGLDEYGDSIGRGTYIYMIKVRDQQGNIAEEFQRLVILK